MVEHLAFIYSFTKLPIVVVWTQRVICLNCTRNNHCSNFLRAFPKLLCFERRGECHDTRWTRASFYQELEKIVGRCLLGSRICTAICTSNYRSKWSRIKAGLGKQLNHKTRMRSNCIEICNKLLRSLSSYDDLFREWNDRSARKARRSLSYKRRMMMYCRRSSRRDVSLCN